MERPERVIYNIYNVADRNAMKLSVYKSFNYDYDCKPSELYENGQYMVYKYEYPIFSNAVINMIDSDYYLVYDNKLICKIDTFGERGKKIIANGYYCCFQFNGGEFKTIVVTDTICKYSKPEIEPLSILIELTERL